MLFVGDTGTYGRAFSVDDPLILPIRVYRREDPDCPTAEDPSGCGTLYTDYLQFDTSTGGVMTSIDLYMGETGTLPVFGQDFTMVNMSSTRIEPACPDDPGGRTAYLAIIRNP